MYWTSASTLLVDYAAFLLVYCYPIDHFSIFYSSASFLPFIWPVKSSFLFLLCFYHFMCLSLSCFPFRSDLLLPHFCVLLDVPGISEIYIGIYSALKCLWKSSPAIPEKLTCILYSSCQFHEDVWSTIEYLKYHEIPVLRKWILLTISSSPHSRFHHRILHFPKSCLQ